jgi:hypothetical protein
MNGRMSGRMRACGSVRIVLGDSGAVLSAWDGMGAVFAGAALAGCGCGAGDVRCGIGAQMERPARR